MANYDELLLTVSNYNASKAQADKPEVVTEKVDMEKIFNIGAIAAGVTAIAALITKIINDNKVKKIIKNDDTLSSLVDKVESTKSKLADLHTEYRSIENEYANKIDEYNEYAKIFGAKTIKYDSITKVPDPTLEDPNRTKNITTSTERPNENFDPDKAKRYKAIAKELNVLANKARMIRSEISREYSALQSYIKQIKKEVRKYKYVNEDTIELVNKKCDEFISDIDNFEEKLKKFPIVESVKEPEFGEGENIITEGGALSGLTIFVIGAWVTIIAKIIRNFIKIQREIKQAEKRMAENEKARIEWEKKRAAVAAKLTSEVSAMTKTASELEKLGKECNKLSIQLKKASNRDEFNKIKNEMLSFSKDIDKKYDELYRIFEDTRSKLEGMFSKDADDDTCRIIQTYLDNIDEGFDELTLKWGESFDYFKALQKVEFEGEEVKESVDAGTEIMFSIFESYTTEEITDDEYDILMSSL